MMYQIEENLLKLAYTKGISSQGKLGRYTLDRCEEMEQKSDD